MTREQRSADPDTMADVDHTHPHTNEAFGAGSFTRGQSVAADGGERSDGGENADAEESETMKDVDHESPGEGVTRTYERGTEGRTDTV